MVTKEQFNEWKTHPVTTEVYEEIEKAKKSLVNQLALGATIRPTAEETYGLTIQVVNQIRGLEQLLNLTYEDEEQTEE